MTSEAASLRVDQFWGSWRPVLGAATRGGVTGSFCARLGGPGVATRESLGDGALAVEVRAVVEVPVVEVPLVEVGAVVEVADRAAVFEVAEAAEVVAMADGAAVDEGAAGAALFVGAPPQAASRRAASGTTAMDVTTRALTECDKLAIGDLQVRWGRL